jgi:hypothetical protein
MNCDCRIAQFRSLTARTDMIVYCDTHAVAFELRSALEAVLAGSFVSSTLATRARVVIRKAYGAK